MMDLQLLIASALLLAVEYLSPFQGRMSCVYLAEASQQQQQQQHLTEYDESASSSSFGEPIFRLEPPSVINFASSQGATILCLASGSPRPTISWYSSSSSVSGDFGQISGSDSLTQGQRPVGNVTNLRQILHNGSALRLLPFEGSDFRHDIHSTEYRCVASNYLATIHSRSCLVQAASLQHEESGEELEVKVSDEFASLNSQVVFRCRSSALAPEHLRLLEWFTSDGLRIRAGQSAGKGNRMAAFITGELHLANAELADFRRSYGCRIKHAISGKVGSSSGLAQLILVAASSSSALAAQHSQQQQQQQQQQHDNISNNNKQSDQQQLDLSARRTVQVLHSVSQLIADESSRPPSPPYLARNHPEASEGYRGEASREAQLESILLPCAIRESSSQVLEKVSASPRWLFIPLDGTGSATPINGDSPPSYRVGPSYLALESPSVSQSGRYLCELNQETVCDIKVIIRRPLRLSVAFSSGHAQQEEEEAGPSFSAAAAASSGESVHSSAFFDVDTKGRPASWFGRALEWLEPARHRIRRQPPLDSPLIMTNPQEPAIAKGVVARVRVSGPGLVAAPPILQVGRSLRLECLASGEPIEGSIRWFVNGEPVNAQTAPEIELTDSSSSYWPQQSTAGQQHQVAGGAGTVKGRVVGTLSVRSLQARSAGILMFECFVQNSLGDRARAGLALFLAERNLLDSARSQCPLSSSLKRSSDGSSGPSEPDDWLGLPALDLAGQTGELWQRSPSQLAFGRANPLQNALLLENEPVKLECPAGGSGSGSWNHSGARVSFEWRKWMGAVQQGAGSMEESKQMSSSKSERQQQQQQQQQRGGARNFNQLFGGDSRFVINGSSLQIRSASKRHDQALYVCVASTQEASSSSSSSSATNGGDSSAAPGGVHQSSLAGAFAGNCLAQLRALFSSTADKDIHSLTATSRAPKGSDFQQHQMSSISIRIVAKPKIEPFEFSRNLEEGMRAWAVCGIVSGQTPVDITWFKDGQLLLSDQETSIEQPADQLSSTLTFHRIRPAHSGLYTCVAANAFSSANHSSRLLVNVAPFFTDPPKSQQAILGSSVLINCRAAGQPSPQIRWRKLLLAASGSLLRGASGATPGGASVKLLPNGDLIGEPQTALDGQLQMAPSSSPQQQQQQLEFRIITSNSHVQILENGSLIIKDVELTDSARYACQAFNGIQPSLSEVIELTVLSPPQFEVNFETLSVKRDALVRFNCAPSGDQPMRLEWLREGVPLTPLPSPAAPSTADSAVSPSPAPSKYSELLQFAAASPSEQTRPRHRHLLPLRVEGDSTGGPVSGGSSLNGSSSVRSSELLISYADRYDSGAFVCVARNAYGTDRLTYRLLVQEQPDTPTGLVCQSAQSSSLTLSWPAPFEGNLPITHYVLEYRKVPDSGRAYPASPASSSSASSAERAGSAAISYGSEWLRLLVPAREQLELGGVPVAQASRPEHLQAVGRRPQQLVQVALRQLQARTSYQVRVAAVNAMGQGAFSTPSSVFLTSEEPPLSRANDLRVQPVSSSQLKVLWRGPGIPDEQAPVRAYYVSHRRAPPSLLSPSATTSPEQQQQQQSDSQQSRLWIATQSVSATNFTSSSSLQAANYEIQLNDLEKNTRYEIRVQPYNSAGIGPSSETSGQTLRFDKPGQPTLKLVAARLHSLELRWSLTSRDENAPSMSQVSSLSSGSAEFTPKASELLLGFSLFYKCEYDDWQEIQLAPIYRYLLENLRCGNKYQLYLSAFNAAGRSEPSEVLSARTEGTVPLAPVERAAFLRANISEIVLDMARWKSGGCPITNYIIQFKRLHDSSWFLLSEGGSTAPFSSSDKIVVPDLEPASWYKLLVSALNEAGTTNAEYVFSTLDPSGKLIGPPQMSQRELELQQLQQEVSSSTTAGARSLLRQLFGGVLGANQPETGLLLPAGCLLLLLITALASYMYYARPARATAGVQHNKRLPHMHHHHHSSSTSSSGGAAGGGFVSSAGTNRTLSTSMLDEGKQLIRATLQGAAQMGADQFEPSSMARILLCAEQGAQLTLDNQQPEAGNGLTSSGGLHTFVGGSPGTLRAMNSLQQQQQQQQHGLRLLGVAGNQQLTGGAGAGASSYTTGAASSSLSTHSTNFDAQSSSQASSSGLNCPQLHLQIQNEEQQVVSGSARVAGTGCHAEHEGNSYSSFNCLPQSDQLHQLCHQAAASNYLFSSPGLGSSLPCTANNAAGAEGLATTNADECGNHLFQSLVGNCTELYQTNSAMSAQARLHSSASFASAADLLQKHQQQELYLHGQQDQEPIYQRLDTFNKQLGKHLKSSSLVPHRAATQTLKFGAHLTGSSNDNEQFISTPEQQQQCNSMSLTRGFHLTDNHVDSYFSGGLYSAAAPTQVQVQSQSCNNAYDGSGFHKQQEQLFYQP